MFAAWGAGERLACMQAAATAGLGLMFGLELCIWMCCRFDCFMPCGSSTCCVCGGMGYGWVAGMHAAVFAVSAELGSRLKLCVAGLSDWKFVVNGACCKDWLDV